MERVMVELSRKELEALIYACEDVGEVYQQEWVDGDQAERVREYGDLMTGPILVKLEEVQ